MRQLERRSVESFLPLYESVRRWKDRRMRLQLPVFPGYIFVRLALRDRLRVLEIPSIVRLVGFGGHPTPLPVEEIETIRTCIARRQSLVPNRYVRRGQRVRMLSGPLEGLTGVVVRQKNRTRFVISLELLMRSVAVEIDSADFDPQTTPGNMTASLQGWIVAKHQELLPADSLRARFTLGIVWSLAGAVVSRGFLLAASIVCARFLGKDGFGALGMIQSTAGMFGIFAGLGLGLTATKYVAEFRRQDPEKAGRILALSASAAFVFGCVITVLLIFLAPFLATKVLCDSATGWAFGGWFGTGFFRCDEWGADGSACGSRGVQDDCSRQRPLWGGIVPANRARRLAWRFEWSRLGLGRSSGH